MPRCEYDPGLNALLPDLRAGYNRRDDRYVESLLEGAIARSPWRLDLRLALANRHIQTESPAIALGIWEEAHALFPRDVDTLTYLAHWNRFANRPAVSGRFLKRLAELDIIRSNALSSLWCLIDAWLAHIPSPSLPPPSEMPGKQAIVTLGYILNPDGAMAPELESRLEKTLAAAERYPDAALLLSGGVPRGGRVEAEVMRDWLLARGVAGERIHEEGFSRNIIENVIYSRQILDLLAVDSALVITGMVEARRAGLCFEVIGAKCGSGWRARVVCGAGTAGASSPAPGGAVGDNELLKLYRDSLRAEGVLLMGIFPHLAER